MNKLFFLLLTTLISGLIISCGSDQKEAESKNQATTQVQAQTQPQTNQTEIKIETMYFEAPDVDGIAHSSTEWLGKGPVVVNFWGTWCPPCRKEIPDLARLYGEYKDKGIEIIGVSLNDTAEKVKAHSSQNNMNWVLLVGDRAIAVKYNIQSVPTTYFFNSEGKLVQEYKGLRSYDDLKKGFESIL